MAEVKFKAITPKCTIGEGPHWDVTTGTLLYVDIPKGSVHRYNPANGETKDLHIAPGPTGETASFVIPCASDPEILLVGLGRDVVSVRWGANAPKQSSVKAFSLSSIDVGKLSRFNDAKCDPSGRVWGGTMGFESSPGVMVEREGGLYRFDSDMVPTKCIEPINLSNGLSWSLDRKTFYYIDTTSKAVDVFDYKDSTGEISNRRVLFDYVKEGLVPDLPDGMTIDVNGNIWVANFFGQKLICIDPSTGRLVRTITTPARNVTSCCWGGPDYSTLYMTSARYGLTEQELNDAPVSGACFEVTGLGTKGLPPVNAALSSGLLAKIHSKIDA